MLRAFFITGLMLTTQLVIGSDNTRLEQIIDSTVVLKQDLTKFKRLDSYKVLWFQSKNCQLIEHTDKLKIPKLHKGQVFLNTGALGYVHDFFFKEMSFYTSKDIDVRLSARELEVLCKPGVLHEKSTIRDLELEAGGVVDVYISK